MIFENSDFENKESLPGFIISIIISIILIIACFFDLSENGKLIVYFSLMLFPLLAILYGWQYYDNYHTKNPLRRIIVTHNSIIAEYKNSSTELFYEDIEYYKLSGEDNHLIFIKSKNPNKCSIDITMQLKNHYKLNSFLESNYISIEEYEKVNNIDSDLGFQKWFKKLFSRLH